MFGMESLLVEASVMIEGQKVVIKVFTAEARTAQSRMSRLAVSGEPINGNEANGFHKASACQTRGPVVILHVIANVVMPA